MHKIPPFEKELIAHYDSHVKYYSPMCAETVEEILGLLEFDPQVGIRCVDLGCGTGWFVGYMNNIGVQCVGIDFSPVRIAAARIAYPNCSFSIMPVQDAVLLEGITDWFLWDVLEHLEEPRKLLDKLGGCIYGSVPIQHEYKAHLQVFADCKDVFDRLDCSKIISWQHGDGYPYALCYWESKDDG